MSYILNLTLLRINLELILYFIILSIFITQLGDHDLALSFCDDIASRLERKEHNKKINSKATLLILMIVGCNL